MQLKPRNRPIFDKQLLVLHPAQMKFLMMALVFAISMAMLVIPFATYSASNIEAAPFPILLLMWFSTFWIFSTGCLLLALFSQKVFGPLYRLQSHISARLEGQTPPPIELRKGDQLTELISAYNQTLRLEPHPPSAEK